jgi:hypothetical protein
LFAALPSVFIAQILPFLLNVAGGIFEVEMQYLRAKTNKKYC